MLSKRKWWGVKGSHAIPTFSSTGSKSNVKYSLLLTLFYLNISSSSGLWGFRGKIKSLKCNSQHSSSLFDSTMRRFLIIFLFFFLFLTTSVHKGSAASSDSNIVSILVRDLARHQTLRVNIFQQITHNVCMEYTVACRGFMMPEANTSILCPPLKKKKNPI